jgi:membrane protein DedA with SNARE-associated domain
MEAFATWLVNMIQGFGYPGLFLLTFIGNVFIPVPLELVMIPAGYLVQQGEMNALIVLPTVIAGDILGSLAGYFIAWQFGRRFLFAYGKYFFFNQRKMELLDGFFARHGEISTLTGRLVPGLRHFMAFPAGLAHMKLRKFILYTGIGGGLWSATLLLVGYIIGGQKHLVRHYMPYITGAVVGAVAVMIILYIIRHRKKIAGGDHGKIG